MKPKQKKIKAWALVDFEREIRLGVIDFSIYQRKQDAESMQQDAKYEGYSYKIVECTITY